MTREEAIARIKNHKIAHKMSEPRAIYISEALDMAIEALEQEPKIVPIAEIKFDDSMLHKIVKEAIKNIEIEPKWIPVSEKTPKANQYVGDVCKYYLVQDRYRDMHVAHFQERGWESIESRLFIDVVAWMPLPPCYEPQEISDRNLKMWEEIYAEEKRRERNE